MTRVMVGDGEQGENRHVQTALAQPAPAVRLRPIALPSEHGGWGMLGAPILAGLVVAPSWAGALVALVGCSVFLMRQPFRLALVDLQKGRWYPRTSWAIRFACGYGSIGLLTLFGAMALAGSQVLIPLSLLAVLGAFQFSHDIRSQGRRLLPEIAGAAAMSCLAAAILTAAGRPAAQCGTIALVLALQSASAISYAAARVRLARNVEVSRAPAYATHLLSLVTVGALVAVRVLNWPIVAAFTVLAVRALWGLSCHRKPVKASMVGVQEVGYALVTVAALIVSQPSL